MFLMDEFDQLGKQPLVLSSIKTIRSYGGRFFIISQSIPGLDSIYGETDRRALQAGAGVQIYMTPQDDRTADTLSAALGKHTIVSKTRSQSAVHGLNDSANISRRSEERPLISASELLRFPLDKVLVLAEGQYPIMAHHIRYYEDKYFRTIEAAGKGQALPYPALTLPSVPMPPKVIHMSATPELTPVLAPIAELMPISMTEEQYSSACAAGQAGFKYGTHSMRRTKAAQIYKRTGNLRAVQLLLGHTKMDSTVLYLGIELEDALEISESVEM